MLSRLIVFLSLNSLVFSASLEFGTPFQINSSSPGSSFNKSAAVDSDSNDNGEMIVVWQTILNSTPDANKQVGNIYVATRNSSGVWSQETQLNAPQGGSANIAQTPRVSLNNKGAAVVIWNSLTSKKEELGNIYVATRDSSGAWSNEIQLNTSAVNSAQNPAVALNENNLIIAIWSGFVGSKNNLYTSSTTNFSTWSNEEILFQVGPRFDLNAPGIGLNNNNQALVAWSTRDGKAEREKVEVVERTSSGVWSLAESISNFFPTDVDVNIATGGAALNDNGLAIVCWGAIEHQDEVGNIFIAQKEPNSNWSSVVQVNTTQSTQNLSDFPALSLNENNNAVIVWQTNLENTLGNIYATIRNLNGSWGAEEQINATSGPGANLSAIPFISLNDSNIAVVSWLISVPKPALMVNYTTKDSSDTWSEDQIFSTSSASYVTFPTINNLNQALIVWTQGKFENFNAVPGNVFGSESPATNKVQSLYNLSKTSTTVKIQQGAL